MGKYHPLRILGAGGFGTAFLCRHKYMNADVVLKTLHLDALGRETDKVFTEAQVLRQLDHPAIIRISECGYVDAASKSRPHLIIGFAVVLAASLAILLPSHKPPEVAGNSDHRKPSEIKPVPVADPMRQPVLPAVAIQPQPPSGAEGKPISDPPSRPPSPPAEGVSKKPPRTVSPALLKLTPGSFQGRSGPMRQALLKEGGGSAKTEAAVAAGLKWLARQQRADGSWTIEGR